MSSDSTGPGPMSDQEFAAFLSGSCLARLACIKPDGGPYVVPIWYHWSDNRIWFVGRQKSAWCGYLDRNPSAAVVIDTEGEYEAAGHRFLTPKVVAEGSVEIVGRPGDDVDWQSIALAMALRYRGDAGRAYVERTANQGRWLIALDPESVVTWRGGGWAKRYET